MRKPRDYDAELKALDDKARLLKIRRRDQLGALVEATGADALPPDILAGALLAAVTADAATREAWRRRGEMLFRGKARARMGARPDDQTAASADRNAPSSSGEERA